MANRFKDWLGFVADLFGIGQGVESLKDRWRTFVVLAPLMSFVAENWRWVSDQGWGAVVFAGVGAACAMMLATAGLLGAVRYFRPLLPPAHDGAGSRLPVAADTLPDIHKIEGRLDGLAAEFRRETGALRAGLPDLRRHIFETDQAASDSLGAAVAELKKVIAESEANGRVYADHRFDGFEHALDRFRERLDALGRSVAEAEERAEVEAKPQAAMRLTCIRLLTLRMVEDVLREAPRLPDPAEEAGMTEAQLSALQGVAAEFASQARIALKETPIMERLAGDLAQMEGRARADLRRMPVEQRPAGVDALAFQDYRVAVARCRHLLGELSHYRNILVAELGVPLRTLNDMRTICVPSEKSVQP